MVGDCARPATMQPAWRAEEEPDNRVKSVADAKRNGPMTAQVGAQNGLF